MHPRFTENNHLILLKKLTLGREQHVPDAVPLQLSRGKTLERTSMFFLDGLVCLSPLCRYIYRTVYTSASRQASTRVSSDVVLLKLRSPSFQVLILWSYTNHVQDHGMYTYTDTHIYKYIHTSYNESSRTQPQLEWNGDVRVLCVCCLCVGGVFCLSISLSFLSTECE